MFMAFFPVISSLPGLLQSFVLFPIFSRQYDEFNDIFPFSRALLIYRRFLINIKGVCLESRIMKKDLLRKVILID